MYNIAVVGLGYVGLPLAVEFGKSIDTLGIDLDAHKINAYNKKVDPAGQIVCEKFDQAKHLEFSTNFELINQADIIIVTVPTPIDHASQPDLTPLIKASETIGQFMRKGAIVIYESTVYPGATEEVCVPLLEQHSQLTWKRDFNVGYSPERINPNDKKYTLKNIVKVVSADNADTLATIAKLYESIIDAGVHQASCIKVAEAAKIIENTQRDINIGLMNELAILFHKLGINTKEVLDAANTKWNFLPFVPGLVGGHCIGVDPYYLTYKAETIKYHPQIILAGRRINDSMGKYIAEQTVKQIIQSGQAIKGAKVTILGLSFKENCPDIRNTKIIDIINELKEYNLFVNIHDPIANSKEAYAEYGIELCEWKNIDPAEAVILAVPHQFYLELPQHKLQALIKPHGCLLDIKSVCDPTFYQNKRIALWQL